MSDIFTSDNSVMLLIDHQVGTMQLIKNIPLPPTSGSTANARLD